RLVGVAHLVRSDREAFEEIVARGEAGRDEVRLVDPDGVSSAALAGDEPVPGRQTVAVAIGTHAAPRAPSRALDPRVLDPRAGPVAGAVLEGGPGGSVPNSAGDGGSAEITAHTGRNVEVVEHGAGRLRVRIDG